MQKQLLHTFEHTSLGDGEQWGEPVRWAGEFGTDFNTFLNKKHFKLQQYSQTHYKPSPLPSLHFPTSCQCKVPLIKTTLFKPES